MTKNERECEMRDLIEREFAALGFSLIWFNNTPNANGPDAYVQKQNKKNRPMSVEIKKLKINNKTKAASVDPVSLPRRGDDFIAIIINSEYVLIQPMKEHLLLCGKQGFRPMSWTKTGEV